MAVRAMPIMCVCVCSSMKRLFRFLVVVFFSMQRDRKSVV